MFAITINKGDRILLKDISRVILTVQEVRMTNHQAKAVVKRKKRMKRIQLRRKIKRK